MGNVYTLAAINTKLVDVTEKTFIVHGGNNYNMALKLVDSGVSAEEISKYFCGYCGYYVPLESTQCTCGHLNRQG